MYLTIEAYKNVNTYVLGVLNDILQKIQKDTNPYTDIDISPWKIDNEPIFKNGFSDTLSLANNDKQENILVYFRTIHEDYYEITGITLFEDNNETNIYVNQYFVDVLNNIIKIIYNKKSDN